jgi:hypothetical protein
MMRFLYRREFLRTSISTDLIRFATKSGLPQHSAEQHKRDDRECDAARR